MTVYTPPANNAVNFELESYTPPVNTAVSFELLDSIQSITGASFTDPDSFGTGVVTATAAITGAGFTDGDSFGTGVVTSTASITGVGFSDADTFGAGTVSSLGGVQNITGVGFSLTNSFGAGTLAQPSSVVVPLPTPSDANNFQPRAKKFEKPIPTFDEARRVQFVKVPETKVRKLEGSAKSLLNCPKTPIQLSTLVEPSTFSIKVKELTSLINPIKEKREAEDRARIKATINKLKELEQKQKVNEVLLDKAAYELNNLESVLPQKQKKLEAINNRLQRIQEEKEAKEAALRKVQLEQEEEEAALMYLLLS